VPQNTEPESLAATERQIPNGSLHRAAGFAPRGRVWIRRRMVVRTSAPVYGAPSRRPSSAEKTCAYDKSKPTDTA